MWIRSQDKELLLNVKTISVGKDNSIRCATDNSSLDILLLGEYSSKEKAMKVLDMIQKFLDNEFLARVFQMPQDEEVN